MELWYLLFVAPISTWGIAYLITQEAGPFNIFYVLRNLDFCPQHKFEGIEDYKECVDKNLDYTGFAGKYRKVRNSLIGYVKGIFDCMYCASPYSSLAIIILSYYSGIVVLDAKLVVWWVYWWSISVIMTFVWESIYND